MQKKYIVDGNLKDDTGVHTTGDILLMDESQAAPLVEIGRLKPAVEDITPAEKVPDGFPQHEQTPLVTEPDTPTTTLPVNTEVTPPAVQTAPAPPKAPAIPTQEQIAKDMEQLG